MTREEREDLHEDALDYFEDAWEVDRETIEDNYPHIDALYQYHVLDDHPDPDYMEALADDLDIDVSDLYDMYYGYGPGGED